MKNLFEVSLTISLIGILLLLFLANNFQPEIIEIRNITEASLNKKVRILGQVDKIDDKETFKIITLEDRTEKIDIICDCKNISLNQNLEIIGTVIEYKENLQIQPNKIIK